eukprot:TRINITY_DN12095_c0_g1_i2.p1 TRINITY_DN12095_c0_g1~~TRINITY_DN12095_c0_g1_i2.p1  ORF type:complete len:279 (-),score=49.66 TRINITY_DN12095_c0_g1_i2:800-1636(-)
MHNLEEKLYSAIYPARKVEDISLDYTGTTHFDDLYKYYGKIIGAGGFGVVLFARDKSTDEALAIKILNVKAYLMGTQEDSELAEAHYERNMNFLKNEVAMSEKLNHPSIIKVKRTHKTQHHVLIVMENARCSLADYMRSRKGVIPEEDCKVVMRQILSGLKYLHISSIVHRDMKPENILLMSDTELKGSVKLSDFGISAKLTNASQFELADTVGTFLYKAPEQFDASLCNTVKCAIKVVHGYVGGGNNYVRNANGQTPVLYSQGEPGGLRGEDKQGRL